MRSRAARALPAVVVLLGALGAGCDGSADPTGPFAYDVPSLDAVPAVDATVRLPFDDYELSPADRARLQQGQARLLVACMAERGLDVRVAGDYLRPQEPRAELAFADATMWGGPFGTMPLDHARRFGYKPAPGGPFVKGPGFYLSSPLVLHLDSGGEGADQATQDAFYGSDAADPPGCLEEVDARLTPLLDTTDARGDLIDLARQHPRVEEVTRAWVACMDDRGHHYADVWEASADFGLAAVTRRQIRVAVDDVACTADSGWASAFYAALADYQRQALERDPDLMESALAAEKARLADVERELAE